MNALRATSGRRSACGDTADAQPTAAPFPLWEREPAVEKNHTRAGSGVDAAALDENAALGADANAIDIGAHELGRADRLIDGRTFVKVRVELLAFVERGSPATGSTAARPRSATSIHRSASIAKRCSQRRGWNDS